MGLQETFFEVDRSDRDDFWKGRALRLSQCASIVYLLVAASALVIYANIGKDGLRCLSFTQRLVATVIGLFVSAGPPAWFWFEARSFDNWVNRKLPEFDDQKALRETYRLNAESAKAFWAAVIAVYAAVLLKW